MHEGPIRFGSAKPHEQMKPKHGLKETIRRAFTVKGAEEAWREKYADEIVQMRDVTHALPDDQRQQYLDQFDADARRGAVRKVVSNYVMATTAVAGVTFAGFLVGHEGFRRSVGRVRIVGRPLEWAGQQASDAMKAVFGKARQAAETGRAMIAGTLTDGKRIMGMREYLESLHITELDDINERFPVGFLIPDAVPGLLHNRLETAGAQNITHILAVQADHFRKWQPLIVENGNPLTFQMSFGDMQLGLKEMVEKGLLRIHTLSKTRVAYVPTEAFVLPL